MTATWLLAAGAPHQWLLPAAFVLTLAVQVGGYLAAERIVKAVVRRRKEKQHA